MTDHKVPPSDQLDGLDPLTAGAVAGGIGDSQAVLNLGGGDPSGRYGRPPMTASRAVFSGLDASGNSSLWVTDGTSAGTSELAVSGANIGGLFNLHYFSAGASPGFTVLGGVALFEGYDAGGDDSLWVTDGTAAGTTELAVTGSYADGLFFNVPHHDLTVFAGQALFAGEDAAGNIGLWTTDATSADTGELAAAGSDANGLFASVSSPDFTVLGGKVLFVGQDTSGNANLWVTDGTEAGTSELAAANVNVYCRMTAPPPSYGIRMAQQLPAAAGGW
jgi:ELWxxDGT repeat protein